MQMAQPVKNCQKYASPLEFTLEEEDAMIVMKIILIINEFLHAKVCKNLK